MKGKAEKRVTTKLLALESPFRIWGRKTVMPIVPKAWSSQKRLSPQTRESLKARCQPAAFESGALTFSAVMTSYSQRLCAGSSHRASEGLSGRYRRTTSPSRIAGIPSMK